MQNVVYISSRNNQYVQKYAKLSDKKQREKENLFLIEGAKLFEEAVKSNVQIEAIFLLEGKNNEIINRTLKRINDKTSGKANIFLLSESAFSKISTEKAPDGVICVAKYLDNLKFYNKIEKNSFEISSDEKILLLCSLRDPGNIGTILRSAVAFGFNRVILSGDCADIYNTKTLRASMGAVFKINVDYVEDFASAITMLMGCGRRVFSAELRSNSKSLDDIELAQTDCFVIGNEGHGIPENISALCSCSVYIPISVGAESLNASVAASILLYNQR